MSDLNLPYVRLFAPEELPVKISDWPEGVGVAVCRAGGRTVSMQPYHVTESGIGLRKRLPAEVGEVIMGFGVYPALRGLSEFKISQVDDQRLLSELEATLRSTPLLVEAAADFAINYEFAEEEGIGMDSLGESGKRHAENAQSVARDQIPVGYLPFEKPDPNCELISGAVLRPAGAAGVDLILAPEQFAKSREMAPEVGVMVREDSLRVAIPLGGALINGRLPSAVRIPAGALMMGQSGGKAIPAWVLRRGSFLFVAPDYSSVATAASVGPVAANAQGGAGFPWKPIVITLAAVAVALGIAAAGYTFLQQGDAVEQSTAPVDTLRSNLFAPEN